MTDVEQINMDQDLVLVSLRDNDERGAPIGRLEMVEFGDGELTMETGFSETSANPTCGIDIAKRRVRIGRHLYPIRHCWLAFPDVMWDTVSIRRGDARDLVAHLLARGFQITDGQIETDLTRPRPRRSDHTMIPMLAHARFRRAQRRKRWADQTASELTCTHPIALRSWDGTNPQCYLCRKELTRSLVDSSIVRSRILQTDQQRGYRAFGAEADDPKWYLASATLRAVLKLIARNRWDQVK